jgi:cadmium resistance protein CadD (predicted permease)
MGGGLVGGLVGAINAVLSGAGWICLYLLFGRRAVATKKSHAVVGGAFLGVLVGIVLATSIDIPATFAAPPTPSRIVMVLIGVIMGGMVGLGFGALVNAVNKMFDGLWR